MAAKWALRRETVELIRSLSSALYEDADDLEDRAENMTERWRDGERAGEVVDFVSSVRDLADHLDGFSTEA